MTLRRRIAVCVVLLAVAACGKRSSAPPDARPVPRVAPPDAAPAGPEEVLVTDVKVLARVWPDGAGPPPETRQLEEQVKLGLMASTLFQVAPWDPPAGVRVRKARVRLEYGVDVGVPDEKDRKTKQTKPKGSVVQAAVMLKLEWVGADDLELAENLLTEADVGKDETLADGARTQLQRSVKDALDGLVAKERVRRGDEGVLIATLASPDSELRSLAFAAIGERRVTAAVPRLLELLGSSDPLTRDGAIGALAALREPRAVKPLTDLAKFQDHDTMRRIVDAIGQIGGEEAQAYLEFVASGHEHPVIRQLAKEALDRAKRKDARGP